MSTHINIHFFLLLNKKITPNIKFLELSEKFPRDSKTNSNQPW